LVSRQWITAMNTRSHPHYVESGWTRQDSEGQFNEIWGVSEWAQTLFRNNTTSAPTPASYPTMISQINQPDQDQSHRQEKLGEFETNRKYFTSGFTSRCLSGVVNNFKSFDSDFISFWVVYVYVSMHVSPLSSVSLFLSFTLSPPPTPTPPPPPVFPVFCGFIGAPTDSPQSTTPPPRLTPPAHFSLRLDLSGTYFSRGAKCRGPFLHVYIEFIRCLITTFSVSYSPNKVRHKCELPSCCRYGCYLFCLNIQIVFVQQHQNLNTYNVIQERQSEMLITSVSHSYRSL